MPTVACADGLTPAARVEWWRHVISEAFVPLTVTEMDAGRFAGTLRTDHIGELMIATLGSSAQQISRTARLIAQSDRDLLQIAVSRRGNVCLEQDGRQALLNPGDLVVYETARPFRWSFGGPWDGSVLTVARQSVPLTPAQSRLITARRLPAQDGLNAVVSRFLLDLADNAGDLSTQSHKVATDITDLVVNLVADSLESTTPRSGTRRALLLQIKDYIDHHLTEPGLTPSSIAATHYISARYLHTLFAEEPASVAAYIRTRRLQRCARHLLDPRLARLSIATIAAKAGFRDLRAFERAFKAAYGVTPGERRNNAGQRPAPERAKPVTVRAHPRHGAHPETTLPQ